MHMIPKPLPNMAYGAKIRQTSVKLPMYTSVALGLHTLHLRQETRRIYRVENFRTAPPQRLG